MLFNNNLHFLRFVLACLVILGHAYALIDPQNLIGYQGFLVFNTFTALAVNGFFVVSGYLIYQSLIRTATFKQYIANRLLRIVPLFVIVIILTIIACSFYYDGSMAAYWSQSSTWQYLGRNITFIGLTHLIDGVFVHNPKPHINGSLWSIPYELFCYFLFSPILLLQQAKYKILLDRLLIGSYILMFFAFVSIHFFEIPAVPDRVEVLSKCVMLFYTGVMLGRYRGNKLFSAPIVLLSFILFVFLYYGRYFIEMGNWDTLSIFPFSIVIMYAAFWPNKLLPKFSKYGDASYGIYLMAFPVQQMFISSFSNWHPFANSLATMIIVIPLAYLSWFKIERPILGFKDKI